MNKPRLKLKLRRRDGSEESIDVVKATSISDPNKTMEIAFNLDRLRGGGFRLVYNTSLLSELGDFVSLEVVE